MSTHTVAVVLTSPGDDMHPAVVDGTMDAIEQVIRAAAAAEIAARVTGGLLPAGCGVQGT